MKSDTSGSIVRGDGTITSTEPLSRNASTEERLYRGMTTIYQDAIVELDHIVGHWIRGIPYQLFVTDPASSTPFDPFDPAISKEHLGVLRRIFGAPSAGTEGAKPPPTPSVDPLGVDGKAWERVWRVYMVYPAVFAHLESRGKIERIVDRTEPPFNKFVGRFHLACPDERVQRYFYVRMGLLSAPHVVMFEGKRRSLTLKTAGAKSKAARYARRTDDPIHLYADITAANPLYATFPELKTEEYERLTDEAVRNVAKPHLSIERPTM